jgi:hypothetical protein
MREKRNAYRILVGNNKERDHWEDLDISGRIILKCVLEKWGGLIWTGFIWPRILTSGGLL